MDDQNRYQSYPGGYDPYPPRNPQPGKSEATTSKILGIASLVCWFFGYTVIGSVILGIIGLVIGVSLVVTVATNWEEILKQYEDMLKKTFPDEPGKGGSPFET